MKASAKSGLIGVSDVKEAIWVLSLLVHFGHQRIYSMTFDISKLTSRELRHERLTAFEDVPPVNEEVKRVLLWKLDALADDEAELVGGEVARCQVPEDRDSQNLRGEIHV